VNLDTLNSSSFHRHPRASLFLASAALLFLLGALVAPVPSASGQSASRPSATKSKDQAVSPAETELRRRLDAAQAAQRTGNAAAIAQANGQLIALALRELAQLRLLEASFPQAIELYRRSLDFQDLPDTRIDLAITELQANHPDAALAESDKALAADPDNARAFNVRGRAWINKQDYTKAAEALTRSLQLDSQLDIDKAYALGICFLQAKDPAGKEKAAKVFEQLLQGAGDSGSLHVLFGRAYRDADDMPAAIREFQRAIALDSRTPHAHYFLGIARLAVNEWKATPEVRAEFAKELEHYPKDYFANYMVGFLASGDRDYAVSDHYLQIAA